MKVGDSISGCVGSVVRKVGMWVSEEDDGRWQWRDDGVEGIGESLKERSRGSSCRKGGRNEGGQRCNGWLAVVRAI